MNNTETITSNEPEQVPEYVIRLRRYNKSDLFFSESAEQLLVLTKEDADRLTKVSAHKKLGALLETNYHLYKNCRVVEYAIADAPPAIEIKFHVAARPGMSFETVAGFHKHIHEEIEKRYPEADVISHSNGAALTDYCFVHNAPMDKCAMIEKEVRSLIREVCGDIPETIQTPIYQ